MKNLAMCVQVPSTHVIKRGRYDFPYLRFLRYRLWVSQTLGACSSRTEREVIAVVVRSSIAGIWCTMFGEGGGSPFSTQWALAETNARWPVSSMRNASIMKAAMEQARAVAVR